MPQLSRVCETCERKLKDPQCQYCKLNKGYQDYWVVREDFKCKCLRCGYTWIATQDPKTVRQCPACRSRVWNVQRPTKPTKPQPDLSITGAFGEDIIDEPPPKGKKKKKSKAEDDDEEVVAQEEDE